MESISPAFGVIIMLNNYFHDVATGLLMASFVAIYVIIRRYDEGASRQTTEFFLRSYDSIARLAKFSFWWIIIAGVPRTFFYKSVEWASAVDTLQVPAIIVKHVVVFAILGIAIYMWHDFYKKVKQVRQKLAGADPQAAIN